MSETVSAGFNTKTWLLWCGGALLAALLIRNPLYLIVLLLTLLLVHRMFARDRSVLGVRAMIKLALPILGLATAFNALTVHHGETILFALPRGLPLIGGEVTLEALAFGGTTGLSLVTLLVLFLVFNAVVDYAALLRLLPGFLFHTGAVASIALAFVPQMLRSYKEIRQAQMIRGHRVRGVRDLVPLFLPFVTSGLEKSLQVAEAMEVRSFGRVAYETQQTGGQVLRRIGSFVALLGLTLAVFTYYFSPSLRGAAVGVGTASLLGLGLLFRQSSRQVQRSRYRQEPWGTGDAVVSALSLVSAVLILTEHLGASSSLAYYTYPQIAPPGFEPLMGLALLLLVGPALVDLIFSPAGDSLSAEARPLPQASAWSGERKHEKQSLEGRGR